MADKTGVYPCYENQFQVNVGTTADPDWANIADCETFSPSFDNTVEEWTPFDTAGWVRRLQTGKGISIEIGAKRNIGDAGNDAVAGLAFLNGRSVEKDFKWTFPDGTAFIFESAVINVTNAGGGDSTNVAPLEFTVMSNGQPKTGA